MERWLPVIIIAAFIPFGFAVFALVQRIVAFAGWDRLVPHYGWDSDVPDNAERHAHQNLTIGSIFLPARYSYAMNGWVAKDGFYLRPGLPFLLFHPLLFIPWSAIDAARPARYLFTKTCTLTLRASQSPQIILYGSLARAVYLAVQGRSDQGRSGTRA